MYWLKVREYHIMKKATKKLKAPNYHAMFFALVIITLFFLFVNSEITRYEEICHEKNQVASSVKYGEPDLEAIQSGYENCQEEMLSLSGYSPLGRVLATLDKSRGGQVLNHGIVYGSRMGVLGLIYYIFCNLTRLVKIMARNIYKFKKSQAHIQK